MSIFNPFKQPRIPMQVGETSGDRIGCYLFGVEMPDGSSPAYHSLAINRQELLEDCLEFFTTLANRKKELIDQGTPTAPRHTRDLKVILDAMNNLPIFVDIHLKQSGGRPFFEFPGMRIFLRTGERPRQKIQGKYIE